MYDVAIEKIVSDDLMKRPLWEIVWSYTWWKIIFLSSQLPNEVSPYPDDAKKIEKAEKEYENGEYYSLSSVAKELWIDMK